MIRPTTTEDHQYVNALAVNLVRAQEQVNAGDKPGSVQFTDAFRSLKTWGDGRYPRENPGLVEWAEMLAADELRVGNTPLREVMRAQEQRVAAATPAPEPAPEPTKESKPDPKKAEPAKKTKPEVRAFPERPRLSHQDRIQPLRKPEPKASPKADPKPEPTAKSEPTRVARPKKES